MPDDTEEVFVAKGFPLLKVLTDNNVVSSKNEFRRLVEGGAITNMKGDEKISDVECVVREDMDLKVGKRRFLKIKLK